jgi:UDP-glucose 4-epimerase
MSKVLVTGGAGFIGSHLSEALLEQGDEVFVIDDLSTGSMDNLVRIQDQDSFHFVEGSILDFPLLETLVKKVDSIFHLAAAVGVQKIIEVPVHAMEINVLGSHNVLTLAARFNKPCLLTSTSEVYGKSTKQPFTEDDDVVYGPTTKSRWSYACSKAIDEFLGLAYYQSQKLPIVIARLFNTTGPRQTGRYGMVLPRFVDQAMRGEPITVFGSGRQSRCFADVSDVVKGLTLLSEHPGAIGQVFNLGNPEEVSMLELAKMVKKQAHSDSEIRLISYDDAYQPGFEDMERRVPNITKASRLGYAPKIKLKEIVARVIASKKVDVPLTMGLRHPLRAGVAE